MSTQTTTGTIPTWTLGDRLRKARGLTGMTTREFAEQIGVSHGTITNAEGDKRGVRPITLKAWALATGVSLEWLEHGTSPVLPDPGSTQGSADTISYPASGPIWGRPATVLPFPGITQPRELRPAS